MIGQTLVYSLLLLWSSSGLCYTVTGMQHQDQKVGPHEKIMYFRNNKVTAKDMKIITVDMYIVERLGVCALEMVHCTVDIKRNNCHVCFSSINIPYSTC